MCFNGKNFVVFWLLWHPVYSEYFIPLDLLPVSNGAKAEITTENFLQEVFDILMDYIKKSNDRSNKILDFHHPDQILESMDFSLPDKPQNLDQILVDCKDALKYQVKTGAYLMMIRP